MKTVWEWGTRIGTGFTLFLMTQVYSSFKEIQRDLTEIRTQLNANQTTNLVRFSEYEGRLKLLELRVSKLEKE